MVVGGGGNNFFRGADLDKFSIFHYGYSVADLEGFEEVVGDEDHGLLDELLELYELVLHFSPDKRVEGAEGLIEEKDLGVYGEGPGQPDALVHATAQLVGVALLPSHQPHQFDYF